MKTYEIMYNVFYPSSGSSIVKDTIKADRYMVWDDGILNLYRGDSKYASYAKGWLSVKEIGTE